MVNHNHNKIAQSNFFIFGYAIFIFFKSIGQILRPQIYSVHTYNISSYHDVLFSHVFDILLPYNERMSLIEKERNINKWIV